MYYLHTRVQVLLLKYQIFYLFNNLPFWPHWIALKSCLYLFILQKKKKEERRSRNNHGRIHCNSWFYRRFFDPMGRPRKSVYWTHQGTVYYCTDDIDKPKIIIFFFLQRQFVLQVILWSHRRYIFDEKAYNFSAVLIFLLIWSIASSDFPIFYWILR